MGVSRGCPSETISALPCRAAHWILHTEYWTLKILHTEHTVHWIYWTLNILNTEQTVHVLRYLSTDCYSTRTVQYCENETAQLYQSRLDTTHPSVHSTDNGVTVPREMFCDVQNTYCAVSVLYWYSNISPGNSGELVHNRWHQFSLRVTSTVVVPIVSFPYYKLDCKSARTINLSMRFYCTKSTVPRAWRTRLCLKVWCDLTDLRSADTVEITQHIYIHFKAIISHYTLL